jgi:hypothetical protein
LGFTEGKLVDGFNIFGLESTDYFVTDLHPNLGGYTKIVRGIDKTIQELK